MRLGLFLRLCCLALSPLVSMSPDWEISMPSHAAPAENPAMQAQGASPLVMLLAPDREISMPSHAAPAENPAMQAQGASPLVMLLAPALHEEISAFILLPEDKAALRASCRYRLA